MNAEQQYQEALKADLARQREWKIQQERQYQEAREADLARQEEWRIEQERQYQYALEEDRAHQRLWTEEELARQQEQQKEELEKNKISWLTFIPCLILSIIADIVEAGTAGTLGWLFGIFVDIILLLVLGLSRGGRKQFKKWLTSIGLEKIPIIDAIPFRTFLLVWSFISSRPKLLKTMQKGLAVASKIPSPIAPELKAVSRAVDIGVGIQQMKESKMSGG
jgi:Flp pilus assembly protein TadB